MILQPSQLSKTPVSEILEQAGMGRIGFDRRLIAAIIERPIEAVPALVAYGSNPPENSRLELDEDILNLLAHLPGTDALKYVVKLLRDGYTEIPESMLRITKAAGPAAVNALVDVYRELEEDSSSEVAFLMAGIGIRDPRILKIILERLDFDMEDGAMLLGLYGDPAGILPLEKLAAELFMTGSTIDAARAMQIGMINRVVPAADLAAESAKLAAKLAAAPTGSIGRIKRMFRWAVEEELLSATTYDRLRCVSGLGKGQTVARETEKVAPVPVEHVDAVLCHLPPPVAAMVRLQLLTGTRPQEVMSLKPCEIKDRGDGVWLYTPAAHKTEHFGRDKVIILGPQAQEILKPWLNRDPSDYCFVPSESVAWMRARRNKHQASSKVNISPNGLNPCYSRHSYRLAVQRACIKAKDRRFIKCRNYCGTTR